MALKGSNKREYQREYMRNRRKGSQRPGVNDDIAIVREFLKVHNVGPESGQHPFYGMPSVVFSPSHLHSFHHNQQRHPCTSYTNEQQQE